MRVPRPLYLGNEVSANPAAGALVATAHELAENGVGLGAVSARHGLRATINVAGVTLAALRKEHFVEVADYDPHADTVLCLGPSPPVEHAGLHALIYRAKAEVGAIVQADVAPEHPAHQRFPNVETGRTVLDTAMKVLEGLRDSPVLSVGGHFILATARTPDEARTLMRDALRE